MSAHLTSYYYLALPDILEVDGPHATPPCDTPTGMEDDVCLRREVLARLMTRYGLSVEEAASAWEQYQIRLRAIRRLGEEGGDAIEHN